MHLVFSKTSCLEWIPVSKTRLNFLSILGPAMALALFVAAKGLDDGHGGFAEPNPQGASRAPSDGGTATLFSQDELMCAYSFRRSEYGLVVQDGRPANKSTDIMFDRYGQGVLAIAVESGSLGSIVDVGPALMKNTDQSVFWYLKRDGQKVTCDGEATPAFETVDFSAVEAKPTAAAPALVGHTYVIKCSYADQTKPFYAAVRVIAMTPQQSLTLRWRLLE